MDLLVIESSLKVFTALGVVKKQNFCTEVCTPSGFQPWEFQVDVAYNMHLEVCLVR